MAVYLHIYNLIISKKAVTEKYKGGGFLFRKDYYPSLSGIHQEDDEMFSLAQMNVDKFDIDRLISNGLSFDKDKHTS